MPDIVLGSWEISVNKTQSLCLSLQRSRHKCRTPIIYVITNTRRKIGLQAGFALGYPKLFSCHQPLEYLHQIFPCLNGLYCPSSTIGKEL